VELCEELLEIFTGVFLTLKINSGKAKMLVLDNNLYATDLADHLVRKGVPFKTAHDQVGQIVSFADEKKLAISKIGLDLLKKFAPRLDGSVYDLFNAENSVRLKKTIGSTHPDEIKKQIRRWEQRLRSRHA
jgi:argininosuccinate lyase